MLVFASLGFAVIGVSWLVLGFSDGFRWWCCFEVVGGCGLGFCVSAAAMCL